MQEAALCVVLARRCTTSHHDATVCHWCGRPTGTTNQLQTAAAPTQDAGPDNAAEGEEADEFDNAETSQADFEHSDQDSTAALADDELHRGDLAHLSPVEQQLQLGWQAAWRFTYSVRWRPRSHVGLYVQILHGRTRLGSRYEVEPDADAENSRFHERTDTADDEAELFETTRNERLPESSDATRVWRRSPCPTGGCDHIDDSDHYYLNCHLSFWLAALDVLGRYTHLLSKPPEATNWARHNGEWHLTSELRSAIQRPQALLLGFPAIRRVRTSSRLGLWHSCVMAVLSRARDHNRYKPPCVDDVEKEYLSALVALLERTSRSSKESKRQAFQREWILGTKLVVLQGNILRQQRTSVPDRSSMTPQSRGSNRRTRSPSPLYILEPAAAQLDTHSAPIDAFNYSQTLPPPPEPARSAVPSQAPGPSTSKRGRGRGRGRGKAPPRPTSHDIRKYFERDPSSSTGQLRHTQ